MSDGPYTHESKAPAVISEVQRLLAPLDHMAVIEVLQALMKNRCPKCFDYDPNGQFWCCYDSRGDD